MKLIKLFGLMLLALPLSVSAQDEDDSEQKSAQHYSIALDDPDYEFMDFKDKYAKSELKKGKLKMECNKEKHFVVSTVQIRKADPSKDHVTYSCGVKCSSFDDKHKSGIVFNYRNEDNFHALVCDKKYYYYLIRDRGDEYVEQRGQYKSKRKSNTIYPKVFIENNKVHLFVDDIELAEVKLRKRLRHKNYGFYTDGKSSIEVTGPLELEVVSMETDDDEYEDEDDGRSRRRSRDYDDD